MENIDYNKSQNSLRTLSKVIEIIAKIGKILITICIPFVILAIVIIPLLFTKLKVSNDIIYVNDNAITFKEKNNHVDVYMNDTKIGDGDIEIYRKIKNILEDKSLENIIIVLEISLVIATVGLFFIRILLKNLEKLFKNIHDLDSPFTLENASLFRKMAINLIIIVVITNISDFLFEIFFNFDFSSDIGFANIMEILILFSLSFIFEYGYKIEKNHKKS